MSLSPAQQEVFAHIKHLVDEQRPFLVNEVASTLGRAAGTVTEYLRAIVRDNLIEVDRRYVHQSLTTRITVIGYGSTPWPELDDVLSVDVMDALAGRLSAWLAQHNWSQNQLARAISMVRGTGINGAAIGNLINRGECSPSVKKNIADFIDTYRNPDSFGVWLGRWTAFNSRKMGDDEITRRRDALEREREERRRALLAAERRPWKRADNDDTRLDAATIAALSGGTIRSLRHG